jgi:membrane-bound lytic murein transglycosylase F
MPPYRFLRSLRAAAVLALLVPIAALVGCDGIGEDEPGAPIERDLANFEPGDTLTALVTFNSTGYFIYRGEPMGFEYRLLREFAEAHDLVLKAEVARDRSRLFHMLNEGQGDVVAARVVPAPSDSPHVAYTSALYTTRPATVQRTGPADSAAVPTRLDTVLAARDSVVAAREPMEISARLIERPGELAGREVTVPEATFYEDRLVELSDSLGEDIHVVEVDSSHEALLRQLARGAIRLTVSPENLAKLKESYYTNLEVRPVIGAEHDVTWAVRRNSPELLQALNEWIASEQDLVEQAYQRYFVDRQGFQEREVSEYLTSETGRLSEYDDLLKAAAPRIGWDWRLLASQTFQESKFDPEARSWAGAMGLLQLMPATAREVDVSDAYDPEENVAGAVRYLEWLTDQWDEDIPDPDQRLRFILASYNAGAGHVGDARRLAEKNGDDPNVWEDVAYWLLQKSKKEVYNDPVVKYGYARGMEPVLYVSRILDRFEHYREFVTDDGREATIPAPSEPEDGEESESGSG